ncbi:hypothetical protein Q7C36_009545 [Tachysurus vachellii]|uniref:Uncharacterized protein n=1 Tax=Tachysurus vachellii TaxID=175792 RepID=A0AA88MY82_TACVA|nr:hypothetical protein Q7C36_009545 [Tachysurus vachellii]
MIGSECRKEENTFMGEKKETWDSDGSRGFCYSIMLERSALRGLLMLMLLTVRTGTELRRSTSATDANTAAG